MLANRTLGRVAVGELLVEHAAEHAGDAVVVRRGGVAGAVGDEPPVELLPRLLVGPPRGEADPRREGERHRDGEERGGEAPAARGPRCAAGGRHPDRARGEARGGREGEAGRLRVARRGRGF